MRPASGLVCKQRVLVQFDKTQIRTFTGRVEHLRVGWNVYRSGGTFAGRKGWFTPPLPNTQAPMVNQSCGSGGGKPPFPTCKCFHLELLLRKARALKLLLFLQQSTRTQCEQALSELRTKFLGRGRQARNAISDYLLACKIGHQTLKR